MPIFFFILKIVAYKCGKCDVSSEKAIDLVQHFEQYHLSESKLPEPTKGSFFECDICQCHFENRFAIRKHLKQHAILRDAKCEICRERLTSSELLQSHICGNDVTKMQKISCQYCAESFQSVANCIKHLKDVHNNGRTMYRCRTCVRFFDMAKLKALHEKYYPHPIQPFQCDLCSHKFSSKCQIRRHMKKAHTGKRARERNQIHLSPHKIHELM